MNNPKSVRLEERQKSIYECGKPTLRTKDGLGWSKTTMSFLKGRFATCFSTQAMNVMQSKLENTDLCPINMTHRTNGRQSQEPTQAFLKYQSLVSLCYDERLSELYKIEEEATANA